MKTSSSVKTSRSRTVNVKYDRCSARSSSACSGNHSSSNTHTSSGKDLGVSLPASSSSLVMPRRDMLASFSVAPVIAAVSAANLANPLEAYAAYGNAPGAGGAEVQQQRGTRRLSSSTRSTERRPAPSTMEASEEPPRPKHDTASTTPRRSPKIPSERWTREPRESTADLLGRQERGSSSSHCSTKAWTRRDST